MAKIVLNRVIPLPVEGVYGRANGNVGYVLRTPMPSWYHWMQFAGRVRI